MEACHRAASPVIDRTLPVCTMLNMCDSCRFSAGCPGGEHDWADDETVSLAQKYGYDVAGICACECAKGPIIEYTAEDYDDYTSINASPCLVCGAGGECAYDDEGRPLIHATTDYEDED